MEADRDGHNTEAIEPSLAGGVSLAVDDLCLRKTMENLPEGKTERTEIVSLKGHCQDALNDPEDPLFGSFLDLLVDRFPLIGRNR